MLRVFASGRLGKNAQHRTLQNGTDICQFGLATEVGYGDNKRTIWLDVSKFGKGAEGLSRILVKGASVAVTGEFTDREYEGKTYYQCKADEVTINHIPDGGRNQSQGGGSDWSESQRGGGWGNNQQSQGYDDLDDDVPF